jgi:acetylornithine deacetylase/succinyl-diaminopimelate desuccinylase-like protein
MVAVGRYIERLIENTFQDQLAKLVEKQSVSSVPEFGSMVRSCAEVSRDLLRDIGARVYLLETDGPPLVVGEIVNEKGAHTVCIYNHYDVQPCSLSRWRTDPWKLERKDKCYYGRGTSDNKGPLLTLVHAVDLACQQNIPLNYLFIYEGEEESGGSHFADGIQKVAETKKPDSVFPCSFHEQNDTHRRDSAR